MLRGAGFSIAALALAEGAVSLRDPRGRPARAPRARVRRRRRRLEPSRPRRGRHDRHDPHGPRRRLAERRGCSCGRALRPRGRRGAAADDRERRSRRPATRLPAAPHRRVRLPRHRHRPRDERRRLRRQHARRADPRRGTHRHRPGTGRGGAAATRAARIRRLRGRGGRLRRPPRRRQRRQPDGHREHHEDHHGARGARGPPDRRRRGRARDRVHAGRRRHLLGHGRPERVGRPGRGRIDVDAAREPRGDAAAVGQQLRHLDRELGVRLGRRLRRASSRLARRARARQHADRRLQWPVARRT